MTHHARRESTVGEIVNLMSVDAENIRNMVQNIWSVWSSVLQIVLALLLLYNTVGVPMLAGFALLVLVVPFNYVMVSKWQGYQIRLMELKDERIKIMSEVLNGIKVHVVIWAISYFASYVL